MKVKTNEELIRQLASETTCTEDECFAFEMLLKRMGFKKARVVLGIVYLEGKGTMDAPPTGIQSIAKQLMKLLVDKGAMKDGN